MTQFAVSGQHYLFNVQTFASIVLSNGGDSYEYAFRDRTTQGVIDDVAKGESELGVLVETTRTADDLEEAFSEAGVEFTELIQCIARDYQTRILNANTFGDWGEDHTLEMMELAEAFGFSARAKVFVYGTLLQGTYNADLIAQAPYLGKAELEGYDLYDLGAYPGIKPAADKPRKTLAPRVLGELRLADAATLRRLHALEGKGSLYDFKPADVLLNGVPQHACVYVYRGQVDPMNIIPLQLQPYSRYAELKQTHVWYACYGSNILMERFMNYIAGGTCRLNGRDYLACSDPTPPVDVRAFTLPYGVYFGNRSISWEGSGVAFLDVSQPGEALGRAYLITREQYAHVRRLECVNANWYPDEVDLGTLNGIPVRTFTNRARREPNAPSATYLDVMHAGIEEAYYSISSSEVEAYLAKIARR